MIWNTLLAAADPISEISSAFGVDWQKFISQVVLILATAFFFKKLAYTPVLTLLDERRRRIEEGLKAAEESKRHLAVAQEQRDKLIGEAGAQANKIIEEARAVGQREIEKASQQAIATASQIIAKAKEANEAELVRMKSELRKEMSRLVVLAASRATGGILTQEQQNRLAEDAVRHLAA